MRGSRFCPPAMRMRRWPSSIAATTSGSSSLITSAKRLKGALPHRGLFHLKPYGRRGPFEGHPRPCTRELTSCPRGDLHAAVAGFVKRFDHGFLVDVCSHSLHSESMQRDRIVRFISAPTTEDGRLARMRAVDARAKAHGKCSQFVVDARRIAAGKFRDASPVTNLARDRQKPFVVWSKRSSL
jgi:hypothetical protein